jgi:DNA-binding transcriptional ArsR family regulator
MDKRLREEVAQMHAQVCSGLADSCRILILYSLADQPHTVTDLAEALELPQSTVSRHLKILRDQGMVAAQRDGQSVLYTLVDLRIIQALDMLRAVMADVLESRVLLARSSHMVSEQDI